jgi:hypothetical protein
VSGVRTELDKQLKVLEKADVVAFGGVGFAGQILPVTEAYHAVAGRLTDELRPKLDKLLKKATPEGKVYAANLLAQLDPAAGREAWHRLAGDSAKLDTFTGCVKARTTLAEYASSHRN